jgi:hypothetical protein
MVPDERTARRVLGVADAAGPEEIRHAYRARAREHHPDRHGDASVEVRARHAAAFAEANEAWLLLRGADVSAAMASAASPAADAALDLDAESDVEIDDTPLTGAQPGCIAVAAPVLLFAAAVVVFGAAVLFQARVLWQASLALGAGAVVMFALAPFFTMLRSRR